MKQKSARIKKIMAVFCCMVMAMAIAGCQRTDKSSPKGLTEVYLEKMKEGKYKEACDTVGAEFDQKSYDKSASLQKELMKLCINQRIIAGNAQFTGIAAGRGVGFTTGLLLLREGLGMRETPIRPHSWH